MTIQHSIAVRNAMLDSIETTVGTAPKLQLRTGAAPANCAAADTGTLVAEITAPSDWAAAAAAGAKAIQGTWQVAASGAGTNTVGHYRLKDSAGTTCHEQGNVFMAVPLTTNGATAANSNVLNFAATTGVVVGMLATGTGIVDPSYVIAVGGTTVTLSQASTAGVAGSTTITFKGDITLDNTSVANGQTVTITSKSLTAPGA